MEPTKLEQLKSRLLGTNNPDARDYLFDRFNNCLNDLKALNDHADANKKFAEKAAIGAGGAGVTFTAGGVAVLSRSVPALAASGTTTTLAASALTYGADMIFAGGLFTVAALASWWFVRTYKKEKIALKNPIQKRRNNHIKN